MFSCLRRDLAWYSKTLLEKIILAILKGLSTMSLKEDYKILKEMNIKELEKKKPMLSNVDRGVNSHFKTRNRHGGYGNDVRLGKLKKKNRMLHEKKNRQCRYKSKTPWFANMSAISLP